jgi:cytochrome b involved in lipid metabolism
MTSREKLRCRRHVLTLQRRPPLEGALSFEHGFIPRHPTSATLPESHRIWDELAGELPELFLSNRAQSILDRTPVLDATPEVLPESALTRAAVVLSALGHAYWRFGAARFFPRRITEIGNALPPAILEPWREVSRRLGRYQPERPFQNFYDLFLANYRVRDDAPAGAPRTIENLDVLVPSFENEAERVFYMSFVEMHHHLAPMVGAICDIEDGVFDDDADAVVLALGRIEAGLVKATGVWSKISARPGRRVFCDPVLWSKTAAILGVPPDGTPQGATSGASAPMLHVLDALLARQSYGSRYGQFLLEHATHFVAPSVRKFAELVRRIPLGQYLDERGGAKGQLQEAFDGLASAYAGDTGWLGRHTSKVFNYLCISTIAGRNASVSGHERYFSQQTWVQASLELHESRAERTPAAAALAGGGCPMSGVERPPMSARGQSRARVSGALQERVASRSSDALTDLPEYSRLEVARHCEDDELWLIIDGLVYDVAPYLKKHPGGMAILQVYAGQEVTDVFWSQLGHHADAVATLLARHLIGRLPPEESEPRTSVLHRVAAMLVRCQQSSRLQYDHPLDGRLGLKLMSDENAHMLLLEENLPAVFELLSPGLWNFLAGDEAARRVRESAQRLSTEIDFRGDLHQALVAGIQARCQSLRRADLTLIARLLAHVLATLAPGGRSAPQAEQDAEPESAALLRVLKRELDSYFRELACSTPGG